jgi:N-acetylglucosamine-6-sulfatase
VLKAWAPHPRPFFMWFAPNAPHGESHLPPGSTRDPEPAFRHLGLVGNATAPRSPNFDEADVSDKPKLIRQEPRLDRAAVEDIDRRYRGRVESMYSVDEAIAKLFHVLKKTGDLRKTYIIFTSDNGLQLGAHRLIFKDYLYEEGERVPLIIRGPGIPEGVTRNQLVSNIDLAPTITALTHVNPRLPMDGISLLPLVQDPSVAARRDLLFESFDFDTFGVRRGDWVYNRYPDGEGELYNLAQDPYELQSRDADPALAGLKAQLSARLAQLRGCSGAGCY